MRLRRIGATLLLALATALPAQAQFMPNLGELPDTGAPAKVEANTLGYDGNSDVISAEGRVIMEYSGYTVNCDRLTYAQQTGALVCTGNAVVIDPQGTRYEGDRIEVTGGMKQAFIRSLTLTTPDGAMVTARDMTYGAALETVLEDATYAPCGTCIDKKGNRIGWRVKAARFVQDAETKVVYLEQPQLEILGVPVAWLPWLWLPDPSNPRNTGFQLPSLDYDERYGGRVTAPFFIAVGDDTDILLSPSLMTRQGFLMAAEWEQRFEYGSFSVRASGIYQLDPGAYAGTVGDRDWRGAIQTSGHFRLAADWTAGWSYTAFTDAAYLGHYEMDDGNSRVNEVYATHVSDDFYADIRLQKFLKLDAYADPIAEQKAQDQQALTLPNARGSGYFDLGEWGQVRASGNLLGVQRDRGYSRLYGPVPYVLGYEGSKTHASGEVSWQKQFIAPGGLVATPYLGVRADVANYDDGAGPDVLVLGGLPEPSDQFLFQATPVAAMDFRWPLIASNGADSHLVEPIAQLVYRGSDTTRVGITNDDAHSFVLDDTNIFSFNRFSGIDRQETGLRANLGVRYLANLAGGQWLEVTAGQSFHLAGVNAFGVLDEVNTGAGSGLDDTASYVVLGARGSPLDGLTLGSKVQVDTADPRIARAGLSSSWLLGDGYSVGGDYVYLPANAATGVADQHEVTVRAGAPLPLDYWRTAGSLSWDLASQVWLEARGELYYDDGYFLAGGWAQANGATHDGKPDSISFGVSFRLKSPSGEFGLSY